VEHVVADGNLIVHEMIGHALIDAFIMSAEQDHMLLAGVFARDRLIKTRPAAS